MYRVYYVGLSRVDCLERQGFLFLDLGVTEGTEIVATPPTPFHPIIPSYQQ